MDIELRDYFAGQALLGFMFDTYTNGMSAPNCTAPNDLIAQWSYSMADCMMKARSIIAEGREG